MMKVAILLIACLAVASAFNIEGVSQASLPVDLQALATCAISPVCVSANASCTSTSTTYAYCPSGTYASAARSSSTCVCKAYTLTAPALGVECTAGDTAANGYSCTKKSPTNGDDKYYWFSKKTQGDTCSSTFDCMPPRQCASGKCYNQLLTGDVCYNYTASIVTLTASCSVKDYCPSGSDLVKYCTPRLAAGSDCTNFTTACPTYQQCRASLTMEGSKTCQTTPLYWIPNGQKTNSSVGYFRDTLCYDGIQDTTSGLCMSYESANAVMATKTGAACETYADCTTYGTCVCASTTSSTCASLISTHATLVAAYTATIAKQKAYYDAGCETYGSAAVPLTSNSAYCSVQMGDYSSVYTVCGAMHNMALSSVTLVLSALFATFFAKW